MAAEVTAGQAPRRPRRTSTGHAWRPRARGAARQARAVGVYAFLIAVSLPIILPYFWLVTVAFSAKLGARRNQGSVALDG